MRATFGLSLVLRVTLTG
jgi:hypothetical protein